MSEALDLSEARAFIEAKVSPIYRDLAFQALDATDPSVIDDIGLLMAGEKSATGFIVGTGAAVKQGRFWAAVLDEVYELFCTDAKKYKNDRKQFAGFFENVVTILATALSAKFGLAWRLSRGWSRSPSLASSRWAEMLGVKHEMRRHRRPRRFLPPVFNR